MLRKSFIVLLMLITSTFSISQCVGVQSSTITPLPPPGGYLPNTTVDVCYTMTGWNGTGSNWLEGFSIDYGSGWSAPVPLTPPTDCNGGSTNGWMWVNSVTSTNTNITVGPGYFFEGPSGPQDNNPGNDWGDFGNCTWTLCFSITTSQCVSGSLNLSVTAGGDGTWGSWGNNTCPTIPYTIYSGSLNLPVVTLTSTVVDDTCNNGFGLINVIPTSPTYSGPYTYTWTPNVGSTGNVTGLNSGTYFLEVGYGNGCSESSFFSVGNVEPTYTYTVNNVDCFGDSDGEATIVMTPQLGTNTYDWGIPTQTSQTATGLSSGLYNCIVTNSLGCDETIPVTISENDEVEIVNLSITDATCEDSNGTITYDVVGGVGPYIYELNNQPSTNNINSLPGGVYTIGVMDVLGCSTESNVTLNSPTLITPGLEPDKFTECTPGTFTFTNTSSPLLNVDTTIIDWGDGSLDTLINSTTIQHTYTSTGVWGYTVSVISDYGCVYTDSIHGWVETQEPPMANFTIQPSTTTIFETVVSVNDWSSGYPVEWSWSAPNATPSFGYSENESFMFPEIPGEYPITLTVTDDLGCSDSITKMLTIEDDQLFFIPNTFTPNGDEYNNTLKWSVLGIDESKFELQIYDRWGEMVFQTFNSKSSWDGTYGGKIVQNGTYVWVVYLTNKLDSRRIKLNGIINVIN
jgi:gliding motility-associated-like protein